MVEFHTVAPQDPLPEGRCVILMRRFAEDSPQATVIELIVRHADGHEDTSNPIHPGGRPMSWTEASQAARVAAATAGLDTVFCVDRTAGPRAADILSHGGDHTVHMEQLDDADLEDGEHGSDLRDRGADGAPRRF